MKTSVKVLISAAVVVLAVALVLGAVIYRNNLLKRYEEPDVTPDVSGVTETDDDLPSADIPETDHENVTGDETPEGDEVPEEELPYECPEELRNAIDGNSDVYAWLTITDTDISYPVCNRPGDNKFYLNHSSEGRWDPMGALFTEDYNSRDFTDSAVVVYGHSMTGKKYFGTLQKNYSSRDFFDSHREIKVFLEDRELTYRIFAAVPFTNEHLLYYYDFSQKLFYNAFMKSVESVRTLDSVIDREEIPEAGSDLLILSTCLKSYNNRRYLVIASLCDDPQ